MLSYMQGERKKRVTSRRIGGSGLFAAEHYDQAFCIEEGGIVHFSTARLRIPSFAACSPYHWPWLDLQQHQGLVARAVQDPGLLPWNRPGSKRVFTSEITHHWQAGGKERGRVGGGGGGRRD